MAETETMPGSSEVSECDDFELIFNADVVFHRRKCCGHLYCNNDVWAALIGSPHHVQFYLFGLPCLLFL